MRDPQERPAKGKALASALASAALYALAQAPFALWPIAFVCLAPLGCAFERRAWRGRVAVGFVAGVGAGWATSLVPAGSGLVAFFDLAPVLGFAGAAVVTGASGGAAFAVFAWLAGDPARQKAALVPWRFGAAFGAGELVRSYVVPWMLLAHTLAPAPRAAQLASAIGVAGLGCLVAAASGAIVAARRPGARTAAVFGGLAIAAAIAAADRMAPAIELGAPGSIATVAPGAPSRAGMLRVALIQPATPRAWSRDLAQQRARLDRLAELSRGTLPVDLLLWPENALAAALPANAALVRDVAAALDPRPALLFGAPRYDPGDPTRLRNAALLWDSDGTPLGSHDKIRLLPFTEYVPAPFARLGFRGGHTAPGERLAPLDLDGTRLGVLICYELLFAEIARALVDQGAAILINPSNDDWFGDTAGRDQMLAAAVLRAIETRRPLLRVTSSGVTAAIDARGRVIARLADGAPSALRVDVAPAHLDGGR